MFVNIPTRRINESPAAPTTNGTYNDFGGVTGLTLVRSGGGTTTSSESGSFNVPRRSGNSQRVQISGSNSSWSGLSGFIQRQNPGDSIRFSIASTSGRGPYFVVRTEGSADGFTLGYTYTLSRTADTVYTFDNLSGRTLNIQGTTLRSGDPTAVIAPGANGFNIMDNGEWDITATNGTGGDIIVDPANPDLPFVAVISHSPSDMILKPSAPGSTATGGTPPAAIVVPCIVRGLPDRLSNV